MTVAQMKNYLKTMKDDDELIIFFWDKQEIEESEDVKLTDEKWSDLQRYIDRSEYDGMIANDISDWVAHNV